MQYIVLQVPRSVTKVREIDKAERIERRALVDEFGHLSLRLAASKDLERRHEQLRAIISSWYTDPAKNYNEEGNEFSLAVGPQAKRRVVTDLEKLYQRLGKKFLGLCTVSLEKLDRVLPADEQTGYVSEQPSGPRSIKAIRKFKETAA